MEQTTEQLQKEITALQHNLNRLVLLTYEMRKRQEIYFKHKGETNLKMSKKAEGLVDAHVAQLRRRGFGQDSEYKQSGLF